MDPEIKQKRKSERYSLLYVDTAHETSILHPSNPEQKKQLEKFTIRHFKTFRLTYWLLIANYFLIVSVMLAFNATMTDFMLTKYGYDYSEAKNFIGLNQIYQLFLFPTFGYILQHYGRKSLFLTIGCFGFLTCFIILGSMPNNTHWTLYLIFFFISFSYSLIMPSIFPSLYLSLPQSALSVGLGIKEGITNLLMALFTYINGRLSIKRTPEAFQDCINFWIIIAFFGFLVSLTLFVIDYRGLKLFYLKDDNKIVIDIQAKKNKEYEAISKEIMNRD